MKYNQIKSKCLFFIISSFLIISFSACNSNKRSQKSVLVIINPDDSTLGDNLGKGEQVIKEVSSSNGFLVKISNDPSILNEDSLRKYSFVIFLGISEDFLNRSQQAEFRRYIEAGGGYLGINSAPGVRNRYLWPWYKDLVGAFGKDFSGNSSERQLRVQNKGSVKFNGPSEWAASGNWDNLTEVSNNVTPLIIGSDSEDSGNLENMISWYHEFDGGRSFSIDIGKNSSLFQDEEFPKLLSAAFEFATGKNIMSDYSIVSTLSVPAENRFKKIELGGGLDEPTELTILPNLDIIVVERKGDIKFYNAKDSSIKKVAHIPVYDHALKAKGNVEMGLMGVQRAPDFSNNHWIYLYYSPKGSKSVDRLSRFKFENGNFKLNSEQIILEVPTQREICCHTGGSIAFDGDDNLFLSVGDNATPFNESNPITHQSPPFNTNGYAPLDDRPGYENFDDRGRAGNTNDLRGSVLRIHVNEDGSYSIPDGNLFPPGMKKTKPEIYAMGGRNLYRISVDKHNGYLYWGDVGPDARSDSLKTRGPRGYDEINQAKKAGYFGWPLFIGDNIPYVSYNYQTGKSGKPFNPKLPLNLSRNNTGLDTLPVAQPAFIWYPYNVSDTFPMLGTGGRTAMAGPVYYVDDYPENTRYPKYYNKKLFIYDFMRNWIKAVTLNDNGDLKSIEPFMPNTKFHSIIDMETGPDGRIYIVEYGQGQWFGKNPDAALSVLDFNGGNRAPQAKITVSKNSGRTPLELTASAVGSHDPDGDKLKYKWDFGDGTKAETDTPFISHTYRNPQVYQLTLQVSDDKGGVSQSKSISITAGNTRPVITITTSGPNNKFYFPTKMISYNTSVEDKEDQNIDVASPSNPSISVQFVNSLEDAKDLVNKAETDNQIPKGEAIMNSLDCKTCHQVDKMSIGPGFKMVAERYKPTKKNISLLVNKIRNGGSGNWGQVAMAAHPELKPEKAKSIVDWIFSLNNLDQNATKYALNGSVRPNSIEGFDKDNMKPLLIMASYSDEGGAGGTPSLTGVGSLVLWPPFLNLKNSKASDNVTYNVRGGIFRFSGSGWFQIDSIDLNGLKGFDLKVTTFDKGHNYNFKINILSDSLDGTLLGSKSFISKSFHYRKPLDIFVPLNTNVGDDMASKNLIFQIQYEDNSFKGRLGVTKIRVAG